MAIGESDVELAGFTEGYVWVVNADCSLVSMELDPGSAKVVLEDKGWCSWRVSIWHEGRREEERNRTPEIPLALE